MRGYSRATVLFVLALMVGMTAAFMVGSRLAHGAWPAWTDGADR